MKKDIGKKLKLHSLLSVLTILFGIMVLLYGIIVEDEPTLVALLLLFGGAVWYFITRHRIHSQHKEERNSAG